MPPFTKPWVAYTSQIKILCNRGLVISDHKAAEDFLSHVNYYRFSGYCLAFESGRHIFHVGTTFEAVRGSYEFCLKIRDLVNEALEIIEVDLRTSTAYNFGEKHGAFGHTIASSFTKFDPIWLSRLQDEVKRSSERFIKHFGKNYSEFPNLPIWVATEVMSFGALSQMFSAMHRADQSAIAVRYGVQASVLESWLHHLVYVRNLCAHHARLWDRMWSIKPSLPFGKAWRNELVGNERLSCTLLILYTLLQRCPSAGAVAAEWRDRVNSVIASPPIVPNALVHMGLSPHLSANSLWKMSR